MDGSRGLRQSSEASFVWLRNAVIGLTLRRLAILGLVGGLQTGCAAPAARPNILLISVDTLRPDRLGCYGATTVETPAIDHLAASGVRFANAFTPAPLTLPAHATLLTGVEPWRHGIVDNGIPASEAFPRTLAERLSERGYDTAAFVSAYVLHSTFGLNRGFDRYDDGVAADGALDQLFHATAPADERVEQALRWLRTRDRGEDSPFFVWLHLFDPHAPYQPPQSFSRRYAGRPYDGEVAFVDSQIGRLMRGLQSLQLDENTVVVLTADHGESLGEHGEQTHGVLLYDATLRVPLIVRPVGGHRGGEVHLGDVTLADVAPTLLGLVGLDLQGQVDGIDLLARPMAGPRALGAISEGPRRRMGWASLVAVRHHPWKYIHGPRPELFDLAADPRELSPQIDGRESERRRLAWSAATIRKELDSLVVAPLGAVERAELAALGYVSSGSGHAPREHIDPKDAITSLAGLDRAYQLFAEGDLEAARAAFDGILGRSEGVGTSALEGLARLARVQGRAEEAERLYAQLVGLDPVAVGARAQLVVLATESGQAELAVDRARDLQRLAPRDPAVARLLARALDAAGRSEEAEAEWLSGLETTPQAPWLRLTYADFLADAGRHREAEQQLTILTSIDPLPAPVKAAAQELQARLR